MKRQVICKVSKMPGNGEMAVRGDWGTLRRKNSNSLNTDLIFKRNYFDDTYGYSIQWSIFEQEMKIIRNV